MSCEKMRKIKTVSVFLALLLCGCANKEAALGVQVSKKVDDEKLSLIVLSKSEYDQKGNIIHKRTGSYKDTAGETGLEHFQGKRAFKPVLIDLYDIYYEHEYDENGNLIHTFIHNTKDQNTLEYSFDYDDGGKIVYCKTVKGDDYGENWYEYDERGNMTHRKSHFEDNFSEYNRILGLNEYDNTYFNHEYEDSFVKTTIESDAGFFLFGSFYFERYYSLMERMRIFRVAIDDEEQRELIRFRDKEPRVEYQYGKKVNTEYYTNYKNQVYGYGNYFGSKEDPVGVDGKIYFDFAERSNKAARTFIEYYLRSDGTVQKSIEYTGFRKTAWFKKVRYRSSHGRGSYGRSLFPDHYGYD